MMPGWARWHAGKEPGLGREATPQVPAPKKSAAYLKSPFKGTAYWKEKYPFTGTFLFHYFIRKQALFFSQN